MATINEIMSDLDVINQQISAVIVEFNEWLDICREMGMTDDEILAKINEHRDFSSFSSLEEAIECFEDLGI